MNGEARRALEEAAARAWPHRDEIRDDGWLLRFSGGGSKRANSVQTLRWNGADLEAAIERAERAYRARGQVPVFQVVDVSEPGELDSRLAARGYDLIDRTLLMTKTPGRKTVSAGIQGFDDPPDAWFDIYLSTVTPDRQATAPGIIAGLPRPHRFFIAEIAGRPASAGLAVAEGPYCGVECMATLQKQRGQGGALAVLNAIDNWAVESGASILWLQVVEANAPARRLYDGAGFQEAGAYWYRVGRS